MIQIKHRFIYWPVSPAPKPGEKVLASVHLLADSGESCATSLASYNAMARILQESFPEADLRQIVPQRLHFKHLEEFGDSVVGWVGMIEYGEHAGWESKEHSPGAPADYLL